MVGGWWLGHPSEKYERQLGWLATQYTYVYIYIWENKIDVPNHQPDIYIYTYAYTSLRPTENQASQDLLVEGFP